MHYGGLLCFCTKTILEGRGFSVPCQCISYGLNSCRGLIVCTGNNLTLLLCKQSVFIKNCQLFFQTIFHCFRPSFGIFLLVARKQSITSSHFEASWVTEVSSPPLFLKRSFLLSAAGGQDEDVESKAATEAQKGSILAAYCTKTT